MIDIMSKSTKYYAFQVIPKGQLWAVLLESVETVFGLSKCQKNDNSTLCRCNGYGQGFVLVLEQHERGIGSAWHAECLRPAQIGQLRIIKILSFFYCDFGVETVRGRIKFLSGRRLWHDGDSVPLCNRTTLWIEEIPEIRCKCLESGCH